MLERGLAWRRIQRLGHGADGFRGAGKGANQRHVVIGSVVKRLPAIQEILIGDQNVLFAGVAGLSRYARAPLARQEDAFHLGFVVVALSLNHHTITDLRKRQDQIRNSLSAAMQISC